MNNQIKSPESFILQQNYPDPFNCNTTIQFSLPNTSFTTLKIFNILGREVATLITKEMTAGTHQIEWNANSLVSGIYYYQLQSGQMVETKKLILLK